MFIFYLYRQLNPSPDLPVATQTELDAAIGAASTPIKVQIFNQAWQIRADNWRDNKPKMERSIALFRALIRDDVENRFHMNHGHLGFALKDKSPPEFAEAEKELTTAIDIRGTWKERGWLFYEFNRAFCRIMLDFEKGPSDSLRKTEILQDLRIAAQATDIRLLIKSDSVFQRWMSLNDLTDKDLRNGAPGK
jgi:hypothetical protein